MQWWWDVFLALRFIVLGAPLFLIGAFMTCAAWGRDNELVAVGVVISSSGFSVLVLGVVLWPRTPDAESFASARPQVPLSEDGRRVFKAAVNAARRGGHDYIGTEHLLIGIASAGPTPALVALERAGISPEAIRRGCTSSPMSGKVAGELPLTPAVRRVLASALGEAEELGETRVNSLRLLLALARDEAGVAGEVLAALSSRES